MSLKVYLLVVAYLQTYSYVLSQFTTDPTTGLSSDCPPSITHSFFNIDDCFSLNNTCSRPTSNGQSYRLEKFPIFLDEYQGGEIVCLNGAYRPADEGKHELYILRTNSDGTPPTRIKLILMVRVGFGSSTLQPQVNFLDVPKSLNINDDLPVSSPILEIKLPGDGISLSLESQDGFDYLGLFGNWIRVNRSISAYTSDRFVIILRAFSGDSLIGTATITVSITNINKPPYCLISPQVTFSLKEDENGDIYFERTDPPMYFASDMDFTSTPTSPSKTTKSFTGSGSGSGDFADTTSFAEDFPSTSTSPTKATKTFLPSTVTPDSGFVKLVRLNCSDNDYSPRNSEIVYSLNDYITNNNDSQYFTINDLGEIEFDTRALFLSPLFLVTYTAGDKNGYPRPKNVTGVVSVEIKGLPMNCLDVLNITIIAGIGQDCAFAKPCMSPYEGAIPYIFGRNATPSDFLISFTPFNVSASKNLFTWGRDWDYLEICAIIPKDMVIDSRVNETFRIEAVHLNEDRAQIDVNLVVIYSKAYIFIVSNYSVTIKEADAEPGAKLLNLTLSDSRRLYNLILKNDDDNNFAVDAFGKITLMKVLPPGRYILVIEADDRFGNNDTAKIIIDVVTAVPNCTFDQVVSEFNLTTLIQGTMIGTLRCTKPMPTARTDIALKGAHLSFDSGTNITEWTGNATSIVLDIYLFDPPAKIPNTFNSSVIVSVLSVQTEYPISFSVSELITECPISQINMTLTNIDGTRCQKEHPCHTVTTATVRYGVGDVIGQLWRLNVSTGPDYFAICLIPSQWDYRNFTVIVRISAFINSARIMNDIVVNVTTAVNGPPRFIQSDGTGGYISITNTSAVGTTIKTIRAVDPEGDPIRYDVIDSQHLDKQKFSDYFAIDNAGYITVAGPLEEGSYYIHAKAYDIYNHSSDSLFVYVQVVSDTSPPNCTAFQTITTFNITTALTQQRVAQISCALENNYIGSDYPIFYNATLVQQPGYRHNLTFSGNIMMDTIRIFSGSKAFVYTREQLPLERATYQSLVLIDSRTIGVKTSTVTINYNMAVEVPFPTLLAKTVTDNEIEINWVIQPVDFEMEFLEQVDHFEITWKDRTNAKLIDNLQIFKAVQNVTNGRPQSYTLDNLTQNTTYLITVSAVHKDSFYKDKVSNILNVTTIAELLYEIRLTLPLNFSKDLLNKDSSMFMNFSKDIISNIEKLTSPAASDNTASNIRSRRDHTTTSLPGYLRSYVNYFAEGSVIASVNVVMDGTDASTSAYSISELVGYVKQTGRVGDLVVDGILAIPRGNGTVSVVGMEFDTLPPLDNAANVVTCTASIKGPDEPVFTWYLGTALIVGANNARVYYKEASRNINGNYESKLAFVSMKPRDSGNITCQATIGTTSNSSSIEANVLPLPLVTVTPKARTVTSGGSVSITCNAGYPDVPNILLQDISFTWTMRTRASSGREVASRLLGSVTNTTLGQVLRVNNLLADVIYICIGTNQAGKTAVQSRISVLGESESVCPAEVGPNGISWSDTKVGGRDVQNCMAGYQGVAYRRCVMSVDSVTWASPNLTSCVSVKLAVIFEESVDLRDGIQSTTLKEVSREINTFTSNTLVSGDVSTCLKTIENLVVAEASQDVEEVTTETNIIESASNLLDEKYEATWTEIREIEAGASNLMKGLENYGKTIAKRMTTKEAKVIPTSNVVLQAQRSKTAKLKGTTAVFPDSTLPSMPDWTNTDNQIKVNGDAVFSIYGDREVSFSALQYRTISLFLPNETVSMNATASQSVNSDTLALSIEPALDGAIFDPPIRLIFKHTNSSSVYANATCSYWDFSINTTSGRRNLTNLGGAWSSDGCVAVATSAESTTCECNHLTNFAILMSLNTFDKSLTVALSYITMIGCGISIACLLVTIILYAIYWKKIKSDRTIIHINLCLAIILADTTFLAGVEQTQHQVACTVVAALLHFFFLAVFAFMLMEGIELYILLVRVFDVAGSRAKWYILSGWGVPALVVGISLGITRAQGYGNTDYCWLSLSNGTLWAFVGPALAIIAVNFIFLVLALRAMFSTKVMEDKTRAKRAKAGVRALFILVPLLGLTWVFGIFAVNNYTIIFQYLFTIFNSLQGLFIFIVHCLMNKQLHKVWCKKRPDKTSKLATSRSHSSEDHDYHRKRNKRMSHLTESTGFSSSSQIDSTQGINNPCFDEKDYDNPSTVLEKPLIKDSNREANENVYDNISFNNNLNSKSNTGFEDDAASDSLMYATIPHHEVSPKPEAATIPDGSPTHSSSSSQNYPSEPPVDYEELPEPVPDYFEYEPVSLLPIEEDAVPDCLRPDYAHRSPSLVDIVLAATNQTSLAKIEIVDDELNRIMRHRKNQIDSIHLAGEALSRPVSVGRKLERKVSENPYWNRLRAALANPVKRNVLLTRLRHS